MTGAATILTAAGRAMLAARIAKRDHMPEALTQDDPRPAAITEEAQPVFRSCRGKPMTADFNDDQIHHHTGGPCPVDPMAKVTLWWPDGLERRYEEARRAPWGVFRGNFRVERPGETQ